MWSAVSMNFQTHFFAERGLGRLVLGLVKWSEDHSPAWRAGMDNIRSSSSTSPPAEAGPPPPSSTRCRSISTISPASRPTSSSTSATNATAPSANTAKPRRSEAACRRNLPFARSLMKGETDCCVRAVLGQRNRRGSRSGCCWSQAFALQGNTSPRHCRRAGLPRIHFPH